ncbi:zinc finger protein 616-like [Cydia strobilella]|uniref:zinc finger protein 616-like n=1 Tax=Cydia strobilella TaxID=1100964 RepID=UPI0030071CD1
MNICRTCLKSPAIRNISELGKGICEDNKSYLEIMMFCLDIKVTQDSKVTTKLCNNCYRKIISFYNFKALSLKNDIYLKSISSEVTLDHKVSIYVDENSVKHENSIDSYEFGSVIANCQMEIKQELDVKDEDTLADVESDEELLSVIQRVKYENIKDETKENAPIYKKRGRPRKIKPLKLENVKQERQVCEECGKSVRNLKEHSLQHLPMSERKKLQCKVCPKLFSTYGARTRHYKIKHLGIKSECNICHKKVVCLSTHRLRVHNREALPFACVQCERRFVSQGVLDVHMTTHTKDRAFQCDVCEKKFRSQLHVNIHKRQVHDKEKTHLCQFCSKTFFKKYHLQVHLRSHTKERPYECSECGKFFSSSSTLKEHRLIHGDVKNYHCDLCDMSFMKPGYLKVHMISHTKEKRYPCGFCGVRFGRSDHRRRHEFTAHQKHLRAD